MHSYIGTKRCACGIRARRAGDAGIIRQIKAAAVPSKLNILALLSHAPHCVCDLMAHTGYSQTLISHHLASLADAGIVESERNGAFIDYSLTKKGRRLVAAIQTLSP